MFFPSELHIHLPHFLHSSLSSSFQEWTDELLDTLVSCATFSSPSFREAWKPWSCRKIQSPLILPGLSPIILLKSTLPAWMLTLHLDEPKPASSWNRESTARAWITSSFFLIAVLIPKQSKNWERKSDRIWSFQEGFIRLFFFSHKSSSAAF